MTAVYGRRALILVAGALGLAMTMACAQQPKPTATPNSSPTPLAKPLVKSTPAAAQQPQADAKVNPAAAPPTDASMSAPSPAQARPDANVSSAVTQPVKPNASPNVSAAQPTSGSSNTGTVDLGAVVAGPDYRLGPEDIVEISIWKEEGLKKEVLVRPDGKLSFALVGEVQAAGRTAIEIQEELTERLKKFLSNPVVSVTVVKIAAQKIYVIGRVNKPGEFSSGRYIDVLQALAMAGGLTVFASPNDIRVMRRVGEKQVAIPFRYDEVVRGRKVEQNIVLKPGDVVVVP